MGNNESSSFRSKERIGSPSSFGEVFLVEDKNGDNKVYAMKKLKIHFASDKSEREAIITEAKNEAEILKSLHHRNIVGYRAFWIEGVFQKDACIVMEYCVGGDLAKLIRKRKETSSQFPIKELMRLFKEMCEGVEYLHTRNVWHRDLKPANVFFG